jgi:hypothetical protein
VVTWIVLALLSVLVAVLVGWALPAWVADRVVHATEKATSTAKDARGRGGSPGLGLAWLAWAVGVATVSSIIGIVVIKIDTAGMLLGFGQPDWLASLNYSPWGSVVVIVPMLLVSGAVAIGLAEDTHGESGRTFGALRVLGIAALAFVAAGQVTNTIDRVDPMVRNATGWSQGGYLLLAWVAATLVIALAANLVKRADSGPGRSLKVYLPLALVGAGLSAWGVWLTMERSMIQSVVNVSVGGADKAIPGLPQGDQVWVWFAGIIACLLALVIGPALAVWRHDLGGRGRLGSAGSLAMGALAGYLLARSAPLWLLGVFALVLLALNLMGDGSSVSAMDRVPLLRWLDGLGRTPSDRAGGRGSAGRGSDGGARAGGPADRDEKPRRDDVS